ncbi:uncharacterized protein LOC105662510 isoform X2 [Megachile rotundata]|uniref:uncharacterized protein LOC105662510 isoform X2 n=1 Tax=Megachile rotundata TaxID=143995 RepID=UPI003FD3C97C
MSHDQRPDERCKSMELSAKSLAKKIENCIVRNALDEEERARKALYLLNARDRRIAFLEKRVAELENVADNIRGLTLRNSTKISNSERDNETIFDFTKSERLLEIDDETGKSEPNFDRMENSTKTLDKDSDIVSNSQISIPRLKLSKCSSSNSEEDIFSTAIDFLVDKGRSSTSVASFSSDNQTFVKSIEENKFGEKISDTKNGAKIEGSNNREKISGDEKLVPKEKMSDSVAFMQTAQEIVGKERYNCPRTSASVPWIRRKRSWRKKLRYFQPRTENRVEQLPVGDGYEIFATFRKTETVSTNRRQAEKDGIVDDAKKVERSTVADEPDGRGTRVIADNRINVKTKSACTQTYSHLFRTHEEKLQITEAINNANRSARVDEDPVPLDRGSRNERRSRGKISSSKEIEYEKIISKLEEKLTRTQKDLEEALRSKSRVKIKYKRSLESIKTKARNESEMLQERIVQMCTSVMENFRPNAPDKRKKNYRTKCHSRLKCHGKISSKLHKKLRMAVVRSSKLKRELTAARKALKNKSEMYESISKCFDELKRDMNITEMNLNKLISENLSLRKKIEDTRDWIEEHGVAKGQNASNFFRDLHRNRELKNLKKKIEEDKTRIDQLRERLTRSESANANKGFLLNSYKSQLTDLNKEKTQLVTKISNLENEISLLRINNSQLKSKDKLHSEYEKSKTDLTEKIETRCSKKCEQTIERETEIIKGKYEETVKSMKTKIVDISNENLEYSKAIKDFLRKVYDRGNLVSRRNSYGKEKENESEREAHETACNILNMTPEQLSGFINEETPNSINSWIAELNRILAESRFSASLSNFLFGKVMEK